MLEYWPGMPCHVPTRNTRTPPACDHGGGDALEKVIAQDRRDVERHSGRGHVAIAAAHLEPSHQRCLIAGRGNERALQVSAVERGLPPHRRCKY